MNTVRLINSPTLAQIERAFAHWRSHREQRSITPRALRDLTAGTRTLLTNVVYAAQTSAGAFSVSMADADWG